MIMIIYEHYKSQVDKLKIILKIDIKCEEVIANRISIS